MSPQINCKLNVFTLHMLRIFIPFLSLSSLVQLALSSDNPDELRHTQDSFPLPVIFFSTISICNIHTLRGKVSSLTLNENVKEKSRQ